MKKRPWIWMAGAVAVLALSACSEKPQENGSGAKLDQPPYDGTGVAAFTAPGWKAGDATSWQAELRARGQYGQNDYTRIIKP